MIRALAALLFVAAPAFAGPSDPPRPRPASIESRLIYECCIYRAQLVDEEDAVYDGDTAEFEILLGFNVTLTEEVRFTGIDTPEVRGDERERGLQVRDWLRKQLDGRTVLLVTDPDEERDKYGRALARVFVDGVDLVPEMIRLGYGRPYFGGAR